MKVMLSNLILLLGFGTQSGQYIKLLDKCSILWYFLNLINFFSKENILLTWKMSFLGNTSESFELSCINMCVVFGWGEG